MATTEDALEGWITTAEAARTLGLTQRRIRQLIEDGELVGQKVSANLWLVKKSSVEAYQRKK